jgi:multicomponent Na+:H+ antiporter subunit E
MKRAGTFLVLLILWQCLTWPSPAAPGRAGPQAAAAGVVAALAVTWILREDRTAGGLPHWIEPRRWGWGILSIAVLAHYVVMANLDVAYRVLHPALPIRPGIVRIHTSLKTPEARTALANAITLTPGTLTVAVTDAGAMYIHWIDVSSRDPEEAARRIAGRFEPLIRKVFE